MLRMFRNLVKEWDVGIQDAVRMTSFNQARKLGLTELEGGIAAGKRADILFLDRELDLLGVLKSGVEVQAAGTT
jgi:N-acetylglucosamine-6-phosphate deacetylase